MPRPVDPHILALIPDAERADAAAAQLDRVARKTRILRSMSDLRACPLPSARAMLLDARIPPASLQRLVPSLRNALPATCRIFSLGTPSPEVAPLVDDTLPFPCGQGVLLDRLRRALLRSASDHALDIELAAEIEVRHGRLAHQSLYARLDVPHGAPVSAVTAAFDRLSDRLHPDRLGALPPELERKARELYASIAEAGRVLRSPAERSEYHRTMNR